MRYQMLLLVFAGFVTSLSAQVLDQNPNFEEAYDQYAPAADSLTQTLGTTWQQTYKAYDWYEAKEERRALRRARRHHERLYNSYNYSYGPSFYASYPSWNWFPHLGFRTGNFWFSL